MLKGMVTRRLGKSMGRKKGDKMYYEDEEEEGVLYMLWIRGDGGLK